MKISSLEIRFNLNEGDKFPKINLWIVILGYLCLFFTAIICIDGKIYDENQIYPYFLFVCIPMLYVIFHTITWNWKRNKKYTYYCDIGYDYFSDYRSRMHGVFLERIYKKIVILEGQANVCTNMFLTSLFPLLFLLIFIGLILLFSIISYFQGEIGMLHINTLYQIDKIDYVYILDAIFSVLYASIIIRKTHKLKKIIEGERSKSGKIIGGIIPKIKKEEQDYYNIRVAHTHEWCKKCQDLENVSGKRFYNYCYECELGWGQSYFNPRF